MSDYNPFIVDGKVATSDELSPEARKQLAEQLAEALKPEPINSVVSLRKVQLELAELGELLELAIERRAEIDNSTHMFSELTECDAEIKAITDQISRYVEAAPAKVDSYHGFIKTGVNLIAELESEEKRLRRCRKAWETAIERVKGCAVYVMQAMGKKRLEGSHGRRLRLHPSPVSVEVTDPASVPDEFVTVTVTMTLAAWKHYDQFTARETGPFRMTKQGTPEVSLSRIKAFIEAGQDCPECHNMKQEWDCHRCNGTGRIPGHVPGARLVKDSVHLRVE